MSIVQSVAERIIDNVSQVIIGKRNEIRLTVLGLLCQGHILIEDVPGVGKTTVGLQFIEAGARQGEPGVIVSFEQFPEQLYADALNFGWDLRALEEQNLLLQELSGGLLIQF